jgi:hypothetical protein
VPFGPSCLWCAAPAAPFFGFGFCGGGADVQTAEQSPSAFWISVRTRSRMIVTMLF